jgi:hypothetical protein
MKPLVLRPRRMMTECAGVPYSLIKHVHIPLVALMLLFLYWQIVAMRGRRMTVGWRLDVLGSFWICASYGGAQAAAWSGRRYLWS